MKDTIYWGLFRDIWGFLAESYPPKQDEAYWTSVCQKAREIAERYEQSRLAKDLLLGIIAELERKAETA